VHAAVVFIKGEDEFGGVAEKKEILQIEVREGDLLVAKREGVERAVGVFLEEIEIGSVVFEAIGAEIAEEAEAWLLVDEEEAAKIGVELLDAGTNGDEIVVGAEVSDFVFGEELLEAEVGVEAVGAGADVGADNAEFADVEIVEADFGGDADAPVDGFEAGVAVEEIEGEAEGLVEK
jgi:hypothetical protein